MDEYFTKTEFQCKCGCGMDISDELKDTIQRARGIAKTPFVITSGARCDAYNEYIGASETSSHPKRLAVDIEATTSRERAKILNSLYRVGITRIGIAKNFIHADIDYDKVQDVIWVY